MKEKTFITITRQYGSGGLYIAEALAKKMGVKCYNRNIVAAASLTIPMTRLMISLRRCPRSWGKASRVKIRCTFSKQELSASLRSAMNRRFSSVAVPITFCATCLIISRSSFTLMMSAAANAPKFIIKISRLKTCSTWIKSARIIIPTTRGARGAIRRTMI